MIDSNFRAFSEFEYKSKADSIYLSGIIGFFKNAAPTLPLNYQHWNHVRADLQHSTGKREFNHYSVNIHYYTYAEAREMFNADTVITYPMNMLNIHQPDGIFLGKYDHLRVFVIQRNERGFLVMYCFTTDKGQRDFKKHFRALQKIFRYED